MDIDQLGLRKALKESPPPDWLGVGNIVYWTEGKSLVRIEGYFGSTVRVEMQGKSYSIDLDELQPEERGLATITHPVFKEIAFMNLEILTGVKQIPGTEADLTMTPPNMNPLLENALKVIGIQQFYSHQSQAWEALENGRSLTLVTPTASGKSNCFLPQAVQRALTKNQTTLLIYPLKVLVADQYAKVVTLNEALPPTSRLTLAQLTGDVSLEVRRAHFQGTTSPDLILASPDVLHHLLYHTQEQEYELWRDFLRRLGLIVLDEAHAYQGSFGIHQANLMRRLRLARTYAGGNPETLQWVVSTATIGNPLELSSQFTGLPTSSITLLDRSGAKRHERTLLTFKPQKSPNYITANLIASLCQRGLKGLVFVNSRHTAKAICSLVYAQAEGTTPVDIFHGSLLPGRRNQLLANLADGRLNALITTNCLEAGLDVPDLDFCLIRGATNLNSFWQRSGRCGRANPGLLLFVPDLNNPIDFYYGSDPERFFQEPEKVKLNPDYPSILARHLLCAGTEGGLDTSTAKTYFGADGEAIAQELVRQRQLRWSNQKLIRKGYPHKDISLRGINAPRVKLVVNQNHVLEELSLPFAHRECHEGAIHVSTSDGQLQRWRCGQLDILTGQIQATRLEQTEGNLRRTRAKIELRVNPNKRLQDPKVIPTKEGNLRLSFWWGQFSQEVSGYSEILQTYAKVCPNERCLQYCQPQSERDTHCSSCRRKLSKQLTERSIEEVTFPQPLVHSQESPTLRLEVNPTLASALRREAQAWQNKLKGEYGDRGIPSSLATVFQYEPVLLALHSLSHALIKAVPLLFLASSNDVSSLSERRIGAGSADPSLCYLFDSVHEGSGTTEALFSDWEQVVCKSLEILSGCDCGECGCPKCQTEHGCPQSNEGLFKPLGLWLLQQICP